jgi:hypothetical protein
MIGEDVRFSSGGCTLTDLSHLLRPDPDSVGPRGYRCPAPW